MPLVAYTPRAPTVPPAVLPQVGPEFVNVGGAFVSVLGDVALIEGQALLRIIDKPVEEILKAHGYPTPEHLETMSDDELKSLAENMKVALPADASRAVITGLIVTAAIRHMEQGGPALYGEPPAEAKTTSEKSTTK